MCKSNKRIKRDWTKQKMGPNVSNSTLKRDVSSNHFELHQEQVNGTHQSTIEKKYTNREIDHISELEGKNVEINDEAVANSGENSMADPMRKDEVDDTVKYDSDGDVQIQRKRCHHDNDSDVERNEDLFITIKHSLATELDAVGEQVWQGALLLSDFICDQWSKFKGQCVVDLGAGTGLSSIVTAMFADHVYCTDTGNRILQLASSNVSSARDYFKYHQPLCPIDVKDLNWLTHFSGLKDNTLDTSCSFTMTEEDLVSIAGATLLIAADVIYDDKITDAFFSTVMYLMSQPPDKTLYVGLERRLVFTIEDLDVTSPGYNHFRDHLNRLKSTETTSVRFTVERIDANFTQFFQYRRTDYLELWKISSTIEKSRLTGSS